MEEPAIRASIQSFIKTFLLHAFVLWLAINTWSWLEYIYKVKFDLAYAANNDGSLVSFKDSFINHNVNQPLGLWVLLIAFLAEADFRLLFQKKGLLWFFAGSLGLGLLGSAISLLFTTSSPFYPVMAQFIETALFIMAYIAGYAVLFNFFIERYRLAKFYQKKSESELHLLKAQINPHFFFNTLNNLYGMALNEKATQTAEAIELLSAMMRYNIDGIREDFISLETELKFIENYLELQKLRIPQKENIAINIEINYPKIKYKIAPMLLIPLIENAWKYGISIDKTCYISLNIGVEKHQLIMVIENSVLQSTNAEKGSGLGISNVQQRLQLIYPYRHTLSIEKDSKNHHAALSIIL